MLYYKAHIYIYTVRPVIWHISDNVNKDGVSVIFTTIAQYFDSIPDKYCYKSDNGFSFGAYYKFSKCLLQSNKNIFAVFLASIMIVLLPIKFFHCVFVHKNCNQRCVLNSRKPTLRSISLKRNKFYKNSQHLFLL